MTFLAILETVIQHPVVWGLCAALAVSYSIRLREDFRNVERRLKAMRAIDSADSKPSRFTSSPGSALVPQFEAVEYRLNALEWQVDQKTSPTRATSADPQIEVDGDESLISRLASEAHQKFRGYCVSIYVTERDGTYEFCSSPNRGPKFERDVLRSVNIGSGESFELPLIKQHGTGATSSDLSFYGVTFSIEARFALADQTEGFIHISYNHRHEPSEIDARWAREYATELSRLINEERRLRILKGRIAEAQTESKDKSDFLAHMSHDIRAPLNNIRGILSLLDRDAAPAEDRELIQLGVANCQTMTELVESILDYSRHRAGRLAASPEVFDLAQLVEEISAVYLVTARIKGLKLISNVGQGPAFVLADRRQLKRIVSNIVGNALKFTDRGTVTVSIDRGNPDAVSLSIRDTGAGIRETELSRLFQPFSRLAGTQADGVGLGLALSRVLADLNRIKLHVSSRVGVGSTFSLDIPAGDVSGSDTEVARIESAEDNQAILLIDDDAAANEVMAKALGRYGYRVLRAHTIRDALSIMNFETPRAVITDNRMPEGGAERILTYVSSLGSTIPVLVVTGDASAETAEQLKSAGADLVLSKPVELSAVAEWLRGRGVRQAA